MSTTHFEGSFLGDADRISSDTKLECGVCWWIYDPAAGDDVWQIGPGVAFADLPKDWRCPNCDAEKHQFMVLSHGTERPARPGRAAGAIAMEQRVMDLASAYQSVAERMRGLPVYNRRLEVDTVGFRRWDDAYVGVVITPWCMNLARIPVDPDADLPPEGAKRRRALPSGSYEFVSGRLAGVGALESCSLFSPMDQFDDPSIARLVATHAIDGAFTTIEPETPEPPPPAAETTSAVVSRRRFLGAAAS